MTYAKTYKGITKGSTPAMRRFRATRCYQSNSTRHKMPNSREAVLEALAMEDNESTPVITTIATTTKSPFSSSVPRPTITSGTSGIKKRVCASVGCSVQHTPIWWSQGSNKKICQRCHQKNL